MTGSSATGALVTDSVAAANVPGVTLSRTQPTAERWEHHLKLTLPGACETVSSAPLNGGFGLRRAIVNRSVGKDWRADDPAAEMTRYVTSLGLPAETTVGLITAVPMSALRYATAERAGWRVHTFLSAGVGNAAAAGGRFVLDSPQAKPVNPAGTVNVMVLLEGYLNPAALVGAVQSVTEAKSAAFRAMGVMTRFGETATGTTTDTVTVVNLAVNLGEKPRSLYAGLATVPGFLVAETVYSALVAALS